MKILNSAIALGLLATTAAHAQMAYETMTTSSTETVGGVTTNVQTTYTSTTSVVPGSDRWAATPAVTAGGSVKVMLPGGKIVNVADSSEAPWNKDPQLSGYDRFTFDPVSGAFVAGSGEAKFSENWDENGNRVRKVETKARVAKKATMDAPAEVKTETTTETTTTAPNGETTTESSTETTTETPAAE